MWPMLLNMTRDECRRTLRRLELEAYSNMISVFRAQGALEDNRKKLLEELRAVLHISNDRHSAEARRVSNDELLATIAEQLAGPNTGLGWISEGRRRVPLMPRGVPQTMYTEIADRAAEAAAAENKDIRKRIETEKLNDASDYDSDHHSQCIEEETSCPVALEDHTAKIWETELICRKRKLPEGAALPDEASTPHKNMRNVQVNTNQKHLNLSQVYSRFSQPTSSKASGHSKHSYNQVSKVSTSKSNQPHAPRGHKHRAHKQGKTLTKAQKKARDMPLSPNKQYNQQVDYSGPPGSFQASYAQSILGGKTKPDYIDEMKSKSSSPGMITDSPTMHLLTQPATVPHELSVSENHPDDPPLQAHTTPIPKTVSGKPYQVIIKKRGDITADKKVQMSDFKVIQKPPEEVKLLPNRQVVLTPNNQKTQNVPGKLMTTKVVSSLPKSRTPNVPVIQSDKMIVVSKSSIENSKILITSTSTTTPCKDSIHSSTNSISKTSEAFTPKGIPATDLKVSAKTFVLNPKSGQKMVVLPAKAAKEGLFHLKGVSTSMKVVSVSSQISVQGSKPPPSTAMSKPTVNTLPSNAKIVGVEPIKTANMADIVPVKGLPPISTTKLTNPIVRPVNTKGNLIVVSKGSTLGKTLTFTKNGNDMSKIIMGKNVNKLLQTSKTDQAENTKSGNVIVLELNNEQSGRTTTMSEILENRTNPASISEQEAKNDVQEITPETPVLFENPMSAETCNTSSLDSTTSLTEMERMEDTSLGIIDKIGKEKIDFSKNSDNKEGSNVTVWDMELETVADKAKEDVDKLNSLHLDLGMSSDSENEFMEGHKVKDQLPTERIQTATPTGEGPERFGTLSRARTLLSQLQDDGSSSNDSSFAIKSKCRREERESEALSKARAKLSEKVAEAKSQQKRIDVYSTAISTTDINLDSFSYLEEGLLEGEEARVELTESLSRLLSDGHAPLHKPHQ
ncbi:BRCA2-interacting transcriptional repressor EMSY [Danaus plexippus]|uniref:BRCA2-interacting transcriptional repressor EMSY n=1 Tax=Danaus plexippus TaxID=13037 RepID=UPI000239D9A9|nr:BRCA2-interacting transcriptional repressor EMSY [Danaus plexippus]